MFHQNGRKKLGLKQGHRRSLLRNQALVLIKNGHLTTTLARAKEVKKLVERAVTIARKGNDFNTVRRLNKLLPYDWRAVRKLIKEIAPKYVDRPGGYTRIVRLGIRPSDTARIARLEWV